MPAATTPARYAAATTQSTTCMAAKEKGPEIFSPGPTVHCASVRLSYYTAKLLPQPQPPVELGFSNVKPLLCMVTV